MSTHKESWLRLEVKSPVGRHGITGADEEGKKCQSTLEGGEWQNWVEKAPTKDK